MIVLDTHALLWLAADPRRVGTRAGAAIADEPERAISTITAYEIALLATRRRIELDRPVSRWLGSALAVHRIDAIAPTTSIALRAAALSEEFPGDPADRLIYATALEHGALLASADERLRDADSTRVLW